MEPTKFVRPGEPDEIGERTEVEVKAPDGMNGQDFLREMDEQNPEEVKELSDHSDEPASEEIEEEQQQQRVIFRRTWDDLEESTQKRYKYNREAWERQEGANEVMVSDWYRVVEEKTRGKGLGGSSKRKIRA